MTDYQGPQLETVDPERSRLCWTPQSGRYLEYPAICKTVMIGQYPQTVIAAVLPERATKRIVAWILKGKQIRVSETWLGFDTPAGYVIGVNIVGTGFILDHYWAVNTGGRWEDARDLDRLSGQTEIPLWFLTPDEDQCYRIAARITPPHGIMARQELAALIEKARQKNGTKAIQLNVAQDYVREAWGS